MSDHVAQKGFYGPADMYQDTRVLSADYRAEHSARDRLTVSSIIVSAETWFFTNAICLS